MKNFVWLGPKRLIFFSASQHHTWVEDNLQYWSRADGLPWIFYWFVRLLSIFKQIIIEYKLSPYSNRIIKSCQTKKKGNVSFYCQNKGSKCALFVLFALTYKRYQNYRVFKKCLDRALVKAER